MPCFRKPQNTATTSFIIRDVSKVSFDQKRGNFFEDKYLSGETEENKRLFQQFDSNRYSVYQVGTHHQHGRQLGLSTVCAP